jgi:hypothetical protein
MFLIFAYSYPPEERLQREKLTLLIMAEIVIGYLLLFTDKIISRPIPLSEFGHFGWTFGSYWLLFDIFFSICWVSGIVILIQKLKKTEAGLSRKNLWYVLISHIVGIIPVIIFGIIFPRLGNFNYTWISSLSGLLWFPIIAYAITKHHLFSIRVITIELATFALWIFIFIRIFLANTLHEVLIEVTFLVITVVLGILLIRGTLQTLAQEKQIDTLNDELKKARSHIQSLSGYFEKKN